MHDVTLYALSIVVRYLPSLWHEIEYGSLNHIGALMEFFAYRPGNHYSRAGAASLPLGFGMSSEFAG